MFDKITVDFRGGQEGAWGDADLFIYPPPEGSELCVASIRRDDKSFGKKFKAKMYTREGDLATTQLHYCRAEALVAAFDHALSLEGINVNRYQEIETRPSTSAEAIQEYVAKSKNGRGSKPGSKLSDDPRYS